MSQQAMVKHLCNEIKSRKFQQRNRRYVEEPIGNLRTKK